MSRLSGKLGGPSEESLVRLVMHQLRAVQEEEGLPRNSHSSIGTWRRVLERVSPSQMASVSRVFSSSTSLSGDDGISTAGGEGIRLSGPRTSSSAAGLRAVRIPVEELYAMLAYLHAAADATRKEDPGDDGRQRTSDNADNDEMVVAYCEDAFLSRLHALDLITELSTCVTEGVAWYLNRRPLVAETPSGHGDDSRARRPSSRNATLPFVASHLLHKSSGAHATNASLDPSDFYACTAPVTADDLPLLTLTLAADLLLVYCQRVSQDRAAKRNTPDNTSARRKTIMRSGSFLRTTDDCGHDTTGELPPFPALAVPKLMDAVLRISDVAEEEIAIRRCCFSTVGAVMAMCSWTTSSPSEDGKQFKRSDVDAQACSAASPKNLTARRRDLLLSLDHVVTRQVHLHCPTHWVLLQLLPELSDEVAAARACAASPAQDAEDSDRAGVSNEGEHHILSASAARVSTLGADAGDLETAMWAAMESAIPSIVAVLMQSVALRQVPLLDSLYHRSFGDPFGVAQVLRDQSLVPVLKRFLRTATCDFWRMCTAPALQAFAWSVASTPVSHYLPLDHLREVQQYFLDVAFAPQDGSGSPSSRGWSPIHAQPPLSQSGGLMQGANDSAQWLRLSAWMSFTSVQLASQSPSDVIRVIAAFGAMYAGAQSPSSTTFPMPSSAATDARSLYHHLRRLAAEAFASNATAAGATQRSITEPPPPPQPSALSWTEQPVSVDVTTSFVMLLSSILDCVREPSSELVEAAGGVDLCATLRDLVDAVLSSRLVTRGVHDVLCAVVVRCARRHADRFPGSPLNWCGFIVSEDMLRSASSSAFVASRTMDLLAAADAWMQHGTIIAHATVAANSPSIIRALCSFAHRTVTIQTHVGVSALWVRLLTHVLTASPRAFTEAIRDASEQLTAVRLPVELTNAFVLGIYLQQSGIAYAGSTGTTSDFITSVTTLLIAICGFQRQADAVLFHLVSWRGKKYCFIVLLLATVFEGSDGLFVERTATLLIQLLRSSSLGGGTATTSHHHHLHSSTAESFLSLLQNATEPAALLALRLQVLRRMAEEWSGKASMAQHIVLKTLLQLCPAAFRYLFEEAKPGEGCSVANLSSGAVARGAAAPLTPLQQLLLDTVVVAGSTEPRTSGGDGVEPLQLEAAVGLKNRALALDILRMQQVQVPDKLSVGILVDRVRHVGDFVSAVEASDVFREHRAAVVDYAAFLGSVCQYAVLLTALDLARLEGSTRGAGESVTSSGAGVRGGAPLSPMKDSGASLIGLSAAHIVSPRRSQFVSSNVPHFDELLNRATQCISSLVNVLDWYGDGFLSSDSFVHRHCAADEFGPIPLAEHNDDDADEGKNNLCSAANEVSGAMQALGSLLDGVEALILVTYRERDSSLQEKVLKALEQCLRCVTRCVLPHAGLAQVMDQLLHSVLRACVTLSIAARYATLTHHAFVDVQRVWTTTLEIVSFVRTNYVQHDDVCVALLHVIAALHDTDSDQEASTGMQGRSDLVVEWIVKILNYRHSKTPLCPRLCKALLGALHAVAGEASSRALMSLVDVLWTTFKHIAATIAISGPVTDATRSAADVLEALDVVLMLRVPGAPPSSSSTTSPSAAATNALMTDGSVHVPLGEVLQWVVALGGLGDVCDSHVMTCVPSVQRAWHRLWIQFLRFASTLVQKATASDDTQTISEVAACLCATARFRNALRGPRLPCDPFFTGVSAAEVDEFIATIVACELRETEAAAQLMALLLHPQVRRHVVAIVSQSSWVMDSVCCGLFLLGKPQTIVKTCRGRGSRTRHMDAQAVDLYAASALKNLLRCVLSVCEEVPDFLRRDFVPSVFRGGSSAAGGRTSDAAAAVDCPSVWTDWNPRDRPVISLEFLRELLIVLFGSIKRQRPTSRESQQQQQQHVDGSPGGASHSTPIVSATSHYHPHYSPAHGSHRTTDGAESVAESETSHSFSHHDSHPATLSSQVESAKVALQIVLAIVQCRTSGALGWSGPHREQAEGLKKNLDAVLGSVRTFGLSAFAAFLESSRLRLEVLLAPPQSSGQPRH